MREAFGGFCDGHLSVNIQSLSLLNQPLLSMHTKLWASNISKVADTMNCIQRVVRRLGRDLEPESYREKGMWVSCL